MENWCLMKDGNADDGHDDDDHDDGHDDDDHDDDETVLGAGWSLGACSNWP